ncbi:MAG: lipopolysaccharide heptosyltransferase II [Candidatus Omnitrophica bacterium]|nr:lipopolysaccharide heptosyltransferase II [Candidatus Omnitrophota bacterium]
MRKVKKILMISLSNIGDVILTTPVLEHLKENFPQALFDILVGPRGKEVLEKDRKISNLFFYNKKSSLKEKTSLIKKLRQERYDLVVDLRHTLIPLLIHPRYKTSLLRNSNKNSLHMRDKHLKVIEKLGLTIYPHLKLPRVHFEKQDQDYVEHLLREACIEKSDILIVIAPAARSSTKRWELKNFIEVGRRLRDECKTKIILVGSQDDFLIAQEIKNNLGDGVFNFSGKTTIPQLVVLLKMARVLITNDSAVLHCGSAVNIPTIAIFGPTDPIKYGPLSGNFFVLRRLLSCVPCEKAQCRYGHRKCLELVKPWEVVEAAKKLLITDYRLLVSKQDYKRILVIRTDRIGDVVLSTPVIKNLRDSFPQSFLAMMVSSYTQEIVEGNPYLDEVIVYDKRGKDRSLLDTLKFITKIRKYRFDLALILHPTNRVHIISFLAGIPKRVGYKKKWGFLNTKRIEEKKYLGEKHELDYNLDLLNYLGIAKCDRSLFFPISKDADEKVDLLLKENGLESNNFVVVHPGASCPSKIWPAENFASVSDRMIKDYGMKVLIVVAKKDAYLANRVKNFMQYSPTFVFVDFSLKELASLLKRAKLFISNDSGPVHIAVAVKTPVISIFGRKQAGLGPKRWGPLGEKDIVLHKDVGCVKCLAHNCKIGFKCIRSITSEEVIEAVSKILDSDYSNTKNSATKVSKLAQKCGEIDGVA